MIANNPIRTERRRHARTKLECAFQGVRLDPDGCNVVDTFEGVDISRSGVGAFSSRSYYPGQRVVVALPLSDRSGHRNIYAKVVRSRQKDRQWEVGLAFDGVSADTWYGVSTLAAA